MKNSVIIIICCFFIFKLSAQFSAFDQRQFDLSDIELDVNKFGPYIGLQQGKFSSIEFGVEFQHKNIKLIKPTTHSLHAGFNYNFSHNLLGYDLGYWYTAGRLNLTYGVNAIFRTDYTFNAIGLAPVIGYKLGQLHMQTGYNFINRPTSFPCNTFFMTLRFVIVKHRNYNWKK